MYDEELEKRYEKEVAEFVPSTIDEIKALNLKVGDNVIIRYIATCPFTSLSYVSDEIDAEIFDMSFQGSEFGFCLWFDDDYGNESFTRPENVKFI